ncbi:prephenate dehydrogenase [Flavisolibacter nicotianae]|uniref:prephenate dehydrogenase n=1 Tax=Flavisolibacter nicotianae TaxID=2364882 RepID=UPI000EB4191C|nr:prephenate dehydrogenase [Flavisolibacter nicotianae]
MVITVVGVGLIGGSMAIALKEKGIASKVIGVESNPAHQQKALELGLVDEILPLEQAVVASDVIILTTPVNALQQLVPLVLDQVQNQVVMDAGSTKSGILELIKTHPNRGRFVATHPMWGTEYSGPEAAVQGAFVSKATVICNKEESDEDAVILVEKIYKELGMHLVYMNAVDHDVHVAYVSHISHITSFALANTVLEKEKEEEAIFELASGGFESTVRLAKSNPAMWVPIFKENRDNVLDVLNEHISQLRKFKACLEKENYTYLTDLIEQANKIRRIIK